MARPRVADVAHRAPPEPPRLARRGGAGAYSAAPCPHCSAASSSLRSARFAPTRASRAPKPLVIHEGFFVPTAHSRNAAHDAAVDARPSFRASSKNQDRQGGSTMEVTGAQALLRCLELEGVEVVFGLPGGAVLPIYDALVDSPIRHVLARHEQGAGHMAEGYAHVSGRAGVAIVTSGPGVTNMVTPLCDAHCDSIPMVVVSGQVNRAAIGTDAFQECNTMGLTIPVTKRSWTPRHPEEIPQVVRQAFRTATAGRPGPVLVDLPKAVAAARFSWDGRRAAEVRDDARAGAPAGTVPGIAAAGPPPPGWWAAARCRRGSSPAWAASAVTMQAAAPAPAPPGGPASPPGVSGTRWCTGRIPASSPSRSWSSSSSATAPRRARWWSPAWGSTRCGPASTGGSGRRTPGSP